MTKEITKVLQFAACAALIIAAANFVTAEIYYKNAHKQLKENNLEQATNSIQRARKLRPRNPYYMVTEARIHLTQYAKTSSESYKQKALVTLDKAHEQNPRDLAINKEALQLHYFLAIKNFDQQAAVLANIDGDYLKSTLAFYSWMKKQYPNDVGVWVQLAKYENALAQDDEKTLTKEHIKELRPDLVEWHPDLQYR